MWSVIDAEDHRVCPQGFGVAYVGKELVRGWKLILRGYGGTSTLPRGATFDARQTHEPQPVSNQPMGVVFFTVRGAIDLGIPIFVREVLEV